MKQEQTKGHGYFRKKKWAKGLVSGIALGAISFASTTALADEISNSTETATTEAVQQAETPAVATQPESTNDNNAYAANANQSTGTQAVVIDNSAVTKAAEEAKAEGVTVTESPVVDKGTDTNTADLNESKEEIKADQEKQVATLKEVTATQAENNQAYQAAQSAIQSNNDYVETSKATYEQETTVTTINDSSTATDGTSQANKVALTVAETTKVENEKSVEAYVAKKANYDATVKQIQILNEAIDSAASDLKNKGVTVKTTSVVVHNVKEVETLRAKNNEVIAAADKQVELNTAIIAAYESLKKASDQANTEVGRQEAELKESGATVTTSSKVVTTTEEIEAVKTENAKQVAAANKQTEANATTLANYESLKKASDQANTEASRQEAELKESGITATTNSKVVTTTEEIEAAKTENAKQVAAAKEQSQQNATTTANYVSLKKASDQANTEVSRQEAELQESGATVTTSSKVVTTTEEIEAVKTENAKQVAAAKEQSQQNAATTANYTALKSVSDRVNSDATQKSNELSSLGATVHTGETVKVSNSAQAEAVEKENKASYDAAKSKQEEWKRRFDELQAQTGTEGYTKQVVLQGLSMATANPQATHGSSASGAQVVSTNQIASSTGTSGYARILDSTGVIKYANVGSGWTTDIDYTNLKGLTVTTADGQTHEITHIHRHFQLVSTGATGLNDVYIPNDPTEGFIVSRNNGTDSYSDFMNFLVTDSYYYAVNGQEVAFTATQETPIALTYSSLNSNQIGREGARATGAGSSMVEINGSTVSVHSDNFAYSDNYNRQEETGVLWDTTDSPYQYKGAAIGVFTQGSTFTTEFVQWDGPANSGGQTYWFAINTRVVAPVIETPTSATIKKTSVDPITTNSISANLVTTTVKPVTVTPPSASLVTTTVEPVTVTPPSVSLVATTVEPVTVQPVSADLVKASNPEKPTLALKTLSETKNQTLSAEYHNYKLNYKPTVSKSVKDTDNRNTNGLTVAKGSTQIYTLDHSNIYANIKNGDTITIKDPLEAGALANQEATLERAANKAWNVAYDEATTTYTFTAIYQGQRLANPEIVWTPVYDNGFYDNTYRVLLNDYDVYSNTVTDYTPEPPKPTKTITDTSGADINGSTVFDKQVHFGLTTDYSPYRKIEASQMEIAKKFAILDDVEDGKFTVDNDKITIVTAAEKQDVKDLFTMYHVLSDEGRTDVINAILKEANLSPVGEFYLWVANDSEAFYKNYIKQAKNITIDLPATLLVPEGVVVKNDFYQIDFGNGYQSNLVTVEVPDVKPEKHALDQKDDSKILDGQEVQIGEYIRYLLDGVTVGVHHDTLCQYDGLDRLDKARDRYTGNWKGIIKGTEYTAKEDLVLAYDVTLADGTLVKAGDTIKAGSSYAFTFEFDQDTKEDFINKIVKVTWDEEKAEWAYTIDEDFLRSLGVEGTFDADFYIEVERIAAGEVENTFINTVNGKEMTTKVTTHTPEPPTPPAPNTPAEKAALLPSTGEVGTSSAFAMLGGLLMTVVGFAGLKRKKD